MRISVAAVLDQVVAEGFAPPESIGRARAAFEDAVDTSPPWFARVIAGFGAWVATGFLLGFLVVSKLVDNSTEAMIAGALLVAGAVLLRRWAKADEEFKRQLALAVSLAGQVLLIVGVADRTDSGTAAGVVALAMSVLLIPLVPDQAHRFMSALIGSLGAFWAMADMRLAWALGSVPPLGALVVRGSDLAALAIVSVIAYVWRGDVRARSRQVTEMLEPVRYGTIVALFGVLLFSALFALGDDVVRGSSSTRLNAWHLGPATAAGITAGLVALEVAIFREQRDRPRSEALVVAAFAALALGFDRRDRFLIGIAVAFLVKFASVYYYSLQMTLLAKSVVLAASGLVLLAGRAYVRMRFGPTEASA